MGLRGFLVVLICAVALGALARFLDAPSSAAAAAGEASAPEEAAASVAIRSTSGLELGVLDVHDGQRWRRVELRDGRWAPPSAGPWRVRAPGHRERTVAGAPGSFDLEPDALLEIRGPAEDLAILEAAFGAGLEELDGWVLAGRAGDRFLVALRPDGCWRELAVGPLERTADLPGGRRVRIAWEPPAGARTEVDLDAILPDRRTAPLVVRAVEALDDGAAGGRPVAGARARFVYAGKAIRFRPVDSTGGRSVRVDVEPTPRPEARTDADGVARFERVALGLPLGVLVRDPASGAWQRTTVERSEPSDAVTIALERPGVTVTGRLLWPDELAADPPRSASFRLVWRTFQEGVGLGGIVAPNVDEFRDHPVEPDGSYRIVTTGPRSGTQPRWQLGLEVLVPGCRLTTTKLATALEPEVALGELALDAGEPWIRVAQPLPESDAPGYVVPLDDPGAPHYGVRLDRDPTGALGLRPIPIEDETGYVGRQAGRPVTLPWPDARPSAFVLRSEGAPDRWFEPADGAHRELEAAPRRVRARIESAPPGGSWVLALERGSGALELARLGSLWSGETWTRTVVAPADARLRWTSGDATGTVALDGPEVDVRVR